MVHDAIEELKQELQKVDGGSLHPASKEDLAQARQFGFPDLLVDFYRDNTENRDFVPGAYLFPLGYVVFASNMLGDAYCLDTVHYPSVGECPVVLFPHDVIEEGASSDSVEQYRLSVAANLEDFVRQFARRTLVEKAKY